MNTRYSSLLSKAVILLGFFGAGAQLSSIAHETKVQNDKEVGKSIASEPGVGAESQNGRVKKIEIIFGGSLCPVCLIAFQKRLMSTDGVKSAMVESIRKDAHEDHSGHPPKRAHAIIEFAPDKTSQEALETIIRQNDFQFIKTLPLSDTNP